MMKQLHFILFFLGSMLMAPVFGQADSAWVELQKVIAGDRTKDDNYGTSVAIYGNYAIVGSPNDKEDASGANELSNAGSVYILYHNGTSWEQLTKLVASDREANQLFGYSVAIGNIYAVVGTGSGDSLYVFRRNRNNWYEYQKIAPSDWVSGKAFGSSVSISGDYILAGANQFTTSALYSGAAYLFKNEGSGFVEAQKLAASDAGSAARFGYSVAINGDYAIVGAYNDYYPDGTTTSTSKAGSAYIFHNNGTSWDETQKIIAGDFGANDLFGYSVAITSEYALVGAYEEAHDAEGSNELNKAGSAYLFHNDGSSWSQSQKLVASDRAAWGHFGNAVSLSGKRAAIGSTGKKTSEGGGTGGGVYIFKNNEGTWDEEEIIVPDDNDTDDEFSISVALEDTRLLASAWKEDEDANGENTLNAAGSAYAFELQEILPEGEIVSQPQDQLNYCSGSDLWFKVVANNVTSYQWQFGNNEEGYSALSEDSQFIGTATDSLTIKGVTAEFSGYSVRCVMATAYDDLISDAVTFTYDALAPEITSTHNNVILDGGNNCSASLPDYTGTVTVTDNCSSTFTITQSPEAATVISGSAEVTLTVTDDAGNSATATFTASIEDHTNPVITSSHSDLTLDAGDNCSASLPDYTGDVTATDNCSGNITISQSPEAATAISSTTEVILTATDEAGNSASVSFDVSVTDNTAPVISSTHSNVILDAGNNCSASLPDYTGDVTATDNCSSNITISQSPDAATTITTTTEVTLTVTDAAGNSASISFNASVTDYSAPVISSTHSDVTLTGDANGEITLPDYTSDISATDNCDTDLDISQSPAAGTTISGDDNTVTLTVTDDNGNEAQATFSVDVDVADGILSLEEKGMSIYPNPTTGMFFIEEGQTNIESITISDYTGKLILTISGEQAKSGIDLSGLNGRLFIVTIRASEGVAVTKIMKE